MPRLFHAALLALVSAALAPAAASAQASLLNGFGGAAGYGPNCLGKSDDGSSPALDLTPYFPGGLNFFGTTHTRVYVNVNGNLTFNAEQACYTPDPFPIAMQPMIAPYWGDVDIRPYLGTDWLGDRSCDGPEGTTACTPMTVASCHSPSQNGVWYYLEPGRMVVTWDRVGYYQCRDDKRMSFQLILTAVATCGGTGDFDVEFRYNQCGWTTGDASGGSGGFGGTPAQAGFDAGNLTDFVEIMGSRTGNIHTILCNESNVGERGVWRFQIRSGMVVCPDAGDACDAGGVGVCAAGRTSCVGGGVECRAELEPSPERCDALDNDCDGSTDEGDGLCPGRAICDRGVCIEGCFEGGCPEGQVCTSQGTCLDAGCESIDCPEGERCVAGACVGACDGVSCPAGQFCRAGRCVDLCETLTCDDCTVCVDGSCQPACEFAGCPSGQTCQADGHCVESACDGVSCPVGQVCRSGSCRDACEGATCPSGEMCVGGECVARPMEDAGVPPPPPPTTDGGTPPPPVDSGTGGSDAGVADAGVDARVVPGSGADPGCSCRAASTGTDRSPLLALGGALLLGLVVRRRRRG